MPNILIINQPLRIQRSGRANLNVLTTSTICISAVVHGCFRLPDLRDTRLLSMPHLMKILMRY